jgi:hypothetical protein
VIPGITRATRECVSRAHVEEIVRWLLRSVHTRADYAELVGTRAASELLPAAALGDVEAWPAELRLEIDRRCVVYTQKEWRREYEPKLRAAAKAAAVVAIEKVYNDAGIDIRYASTRQVARSIFAEGM